MLISSFEHATPLGPMWSHWTAQGLYRLDWTSSADAAELVHTPDQNRSALDLEARLTRFYQSEDACFDEIEIDPIGWTDFARRVYEQCRMIPSGTTVTYKQLAAMAGNEKASRAVGAAMARNRILLVVPCHRVIAANGKLRGFSAPGGLQTKKALLDLEANCQLASSR